MRLAPHGERDHADLDEIRPVEGVSWASRSDPSETDAAVWGLGLPGATIQRLFYRK